MALYKESMLNKIEDDLAGRNQNWDTLEAHLADYADLADTLDTHLADYADLVANNIIESNGRNSNGTWLKYANGEMECYVSGLQLEYISSKIFRVTWTFPQPFAEIPTVIPVDELNYGGGALIPLRGHTNIALSSKTNSRVTIDIFTGIDFDETTFHDRYEWFKVGALAKGRFKE